MAFGGFPSQDARDRYVDDEAREMLLEDLSYEDRRKIVASARRREILDHGHAGPYCSLLEPDVRARVTARLDACRVQSGEKSRLFVVSPPATTARLSRGLFAEPTKRPGLLCIGADGAETGVSSRFDDLEPLIRFDNILQVSCLRVCEHDNDAAIILGAANQECKALIERIIDESGLLEQHPDLLAFLLLDGGGVYKFAPSKATCDFCKLALSVIAKDSETTRKVECKATLEDFKMLVNIPPQRICSALLHCLCTLVLRIRKKGLTDRERQTLDDWNLKETGRAFVRVKHDGKRDEQSAPRDGKLEIEALDALLYPVTAEVRREVQIMQRRAAGGAGDAAGAAGQAPAAMHDQPPAPKRRDVDLVRRRDQQFESMLEKAWPERWHAAIRGIRSLREADVMPDALEVLGRIHDDFERHAPDGGWSIGCHFLAHSLAFARDYAGNDLRVLHEQLVERQNQRIKAKLRHWSGDSSRAIAAINASNGRTRVGEQPPAAPSAAKVGDAMAAWAAADAAV